MHYYKMIFFELPTIFTFFFKNIFQRWKPIKGIEVNKLLKDLILQGSSLGLGTRGVKRVKDHKLTVKVKLRTTPLASI